VRSILKPTPDKKGFVARERGLQLRWLLAGIVLLLAALAFVFLRASLQDMGDAHGLLAKVVIIAVLLGFLLVLAAPLIYARIRGAALQSEDGVYVEFQGRRMRTLEQGDALWLHADDVHAVLGLPEHFAPKNFTADEYAVIKDHTAAYSLAGVQKLASFTTAGKSARAAAALPRWFEFEVLKPWQRRNQIHVYAPLQYKE
jgi:4-amino-4-deoxy-L-arabinose transferase-like glycosyltransferase